MDNVGLIIAIVLAVGAVSFFVGYFFKQIALRDQVKAATENAARIVADATTRQKELLLEAKDEALQLRNNVEAEIRERRTDLQRQERRLQQREENLDRKIETSERRERLLQQREKEVEGLRGEAEGLKLAEEFVHRGGLRRYGLQRNELAGTTTSRLSPHLHFGTVSVRQLVRMARASEAASAKRPRQNPIPARDANGVSAWIGELIWREFYAQVLWHFPNAARGSFRRQYEDIAWENDEEKFAAWCAGRTGYSLVDAAMRELQATGWMHNRARMIVVSFLTKDLLIDWRWGERYFMQHLIDGDVASNNGGWQWVAGTGTDAQPFFRIFNPVEQGKRYDAAGEYVRRWVPELAQVPTRYIHAPWTMPEEVARAAGIKVGGEYPAPIVDHAEQRARALALFR
jgi:deoxyribodipyrimidine photo-lyase